MKRFWTDVTTIAGDSGWSIQLDGRPVLTPARALLTLPTAELAGAVADEWRRVGEGIDPRAMPLTGLANAAIDRVAAGKDAFAGDLGAYAESDLLCYRSDGPPSLVDLQAAAWDPLLAWARRRYDVDFVVTAGIIHRPQPAATVDRLRHAVLALDPFRLAALSPLTTIGGSLVAALAVIEEAIEPDAAWDAVTVDERWQLDQWGQDAAAMTALNLRRHDFLAAARFVFLL